jgi:hypothetical protein
VISSYHNPAFSAKPGFSVIVRSMLQIVLKENPVFLFCSQGTAGPTRFILKSSKCNMLLPTTKAGVFCDGQEHVAK